MERIKDVLSFVEQLDEEELLTVIMDYLRSRIGQKEFIVHHAKKKYKIIEQEICYIFSEKGDTLVFTQAACYRSSRSLDGWERELDNRLFVRTHRQNIVNLAYVDKVEKEIYLKTGDKVLLSRRKRKIFEGAYQKYNRYFGGDSCAGI